ncbi:hypothetical protein [Flagellimonas allohymeniacidonis]|uniref:Uncharacterized protein n=1 Tax=Flagellimonas allohymeniacidonis TaxID=2517819 RepID=A0A4Q8Q9G2_9FLAO|nr:hypothetical protein [Allomuricauda hymeniacidonis]TAI46851.1 hypothetical protein EW142_09110 [Allomuricauda hymeniacidonis]
MQTIVQAFIIALEIYFLAGLVFGLIFLFSAKRIDPLLGNSKKRVRFLLFPGVVATWPFLLGKLFNSKTVN